MTPAVVLGVGNAFRRDDGVGPAVAELLHLLAPGVEVLTLDGEPARLVDAWTGAAAAIVVDACRSGAPPGTLTRIEVDGDRPPPVLTPGPVASTHAASVAEAVALGRALGRMPSRIVVYAVDGADFGPGPGLSDAVAAVVGDVATQVLAELSRLGAVAAGELTY